jgi:hypothetical protein
MRTTYRTIAQLIALLVVVQAAMIAFVISGLFTWVITGGGVLDAATLESPDGLDFPEVVGFVVHGMSGLFVIPALALVLLVVSFFAKVPRGVLLAAVLLALIVVQVLLAYGRVPGTALLHGANALVVFTVALTAARAARRTPARVEAQAGSDVTV